MANVRDTTINPTDFLTMYQKMQRLNPLAYERVCGIIDEISIWENTLLNSIEQEKEEINEQTSNI